MTLRKKLDIVAVLGVVLLAYYATPSSKPYVWADPQRQKCIDLRNIYLGAGNAHVDPRFNMRGMSEDYQTDRLVEYMTCMENLKKIGIDDLGNYNYNGRKDIE